MHDLKEAGTDLLTITQYMRPSERHHPITRWVKPQTFVDLRDEGERMGFLGVMSGPLVRSSYRAGKLWAQAMRARGEEIPAHLAHLDRDVAARQEAQAVVDAFGEGDEVHYCVDPSHPVRIEARACQRTAKPPARASSAARRRTGPPRRDRPNPADARGLQPRPEAQPRFRLAHGRRARGSHAGRRPRRPARQRRCLRHHPLGHLRPPRRRRARDVHARPVRGDRRIRSDARPGRCDRSGPQHRAARLADGSSSPSPSTPARRRWSSAPPGGPAWCSWAKAAAGTR